MGAKAKKGKKSKKGKKKKGLNDEVDKKELQFQLMAKMHSMNNLLERQQTRAQSARTACNEKRYRQLELFRFEEDAEKTTNDILADMTRQWKSKEAELLGQIGYNDSII